VFLISGRVETNSEKGCFRSRDVDFCGIERVSGGWREVVVREREVVIKEREVVVREWEVVIKELTIICSRDFRRTSKMVNSHWLKFA